MSVKKFLIKRLSYFQRVKRKKQVIDRIAQCDSFENQDIVNIHRIDVNNVGDYFCAPHHYFDRLKGKALDIYDYKKPDLSVTENFVEKVISDALIIGGGGILNRSSFENQMKLFENIAQKGKKTVIWGAGHNEKNRKNFGKVRSYNVDLSKFGLVGVRDYDMGQQWVPCVSCLHPLLDTKAPVTNEIGLVFHKKTLKNKAVLEKFKDYPSTSNTTDIHTIINFIASTETIITDSYHAMYWAMLMEKKVVVFPNSSKFYSFKYQPVFSDIKNFKTDLSKAQSYSGILEECRGINRNFAEKVFDYLG
ncbi:MAG: polysaccharide pyruvyl transferase family protein [Flavobacteriaceae bacterium]